MGLSRRFLNLIMESNDKAIKSLRCIDLKRLQLFYPTSPPPATRPPTMEMETFELPSPHSNFEASSMDSVYQIHKRVACYPLGAQRKVLCTDQCGRNFLYDASTHQVATMPEIHRPRLHSVSLFIPSDQFKDDGNREDRAGHGEGEGEDDNSKEGREDEEGQGSLFLMEKLLKPVTRDFGHPASDVEILFHGNGSKTSHCKLLPPPSSHWNAPSKIDSYAVVGNGSHICISVDGRGTYFLDTARHTWDKVGDWALPFRGKAEYVPELKLWFGLSADAQHLAAADLSTMDAQPQQLVYGWKEFQPPEDWVELIDAQLVNLGSGRFCIARFFRYDKFEDIEDDCFQDVAVLTGLEVQPVLNGDGKVTLKMTPHKSMCHNASPACRIYTSLVF